ncbi:MAG TPA: hypothetical protein VGN23_01590 [Verrucomicrobiae bacterium]
MVAIFALSLQLLHADDAQNKIFAARAEAEFHRTQKIYQTAENATNAIPFARACFNFAGFATNKTQRASIAHLGISACRKTVADNPKLAAAHYYLAMNLGQMAQTEFMGALRIVSEMEREFKTAATLDPHYDYAGPERCLGLLYRDAPGWPASIGSNRKAKTYLEQAVTLAPNDPENLLNLAETDLQWHDLKPAQKEMAALDALWPKAQKEFTGDSWEHDRVDWTNRREALRQKLSSPVKSR